MNLQATLASLIRHGLTIFAGYLVAKGTIDGSTSTAIIGLVPGLAGIAWSFLHKWKVTRQITAAFDTNPTASDQTKADVLAKA